MRWMSCIVALLFAGEANPVQFATDTHNFTLTGGGVAGLLSGNLSVETSCDNFNSGVFVGQDCSAYLSALISIRGDADPAIINDADALARYQMAAFSVSQYQLSRGGNAFNNGIPAVAPDRVDADAALEQASEWYANPDSNRIFSANLLIMNELTCCWGPVERQVPGATDFPGATNHGGSKSGAQAARERLASGRLPCIFARPGRLAITTKSEKI